MELPYILALSFFIALDISLAKSSDLPSKGRSTFDYLLASQNKDGKGELRVPYPFDKLIELIKSKSNPKSKLPVSVLFIPFGRSLQRFAADPNFFKYPRVLVTVNDHTPFNDQKIPLSLRSSLYVAYVEPSNMLEVISYNPIEARFEFQVVKNYKKGAKPELFYAPRNLCNLSSTLKIMKY